MDFFYISPDCVAVLCSPIYATALHSGRQSLKHQFYVRV